MDSLLILLAALVIDLVLGEPPRLIHPVVWVGKVARLFKVGERWFSPCAQFAFGAGITLLIMGLFTAPAYFVLYYLPGFSFVAYLVVGAVFLKCAFSLKEFRRAAITVKRLLVEEKLDEARFALRSLVSRDTSDLSKPLVVSAAVESLAENTCDSFVAPLFYFLLFGVPGAVAYRVVNTLDAMVGYHGKYEYLGKFVAKLDDVLNFVPARLAALLLVLASLLSPKGARASWRVARSEHARTESPNAGWTMAAMAGGLGVQLEKVGHYRLGEADMPLIPATIDAALQIMLISMLSWSIICVMVGVIRFVTTT